MDGQQLNYVNGDGYNGSGGIIAQAGEALQKDLDSLMDVLEEVKDKILFYNVKIIYDVGILIKNLEEDKMGIFCFSLDDFIVINNSFFYL